MELGLKPYILNTIKVDNPIDNAYAAFCMLNRWKETNKKATRSTLNQAIEKCRAKKGIGLLNMIKVFIYAEGMYVGDYG